MSVPNYKPFALLWSAVVAFFSLAFGIMTLLGFPGAEVYFWTRQPVASQTGIILWIVVSAIFFVVLFTLAVREYRKKHGPSSS